jgi:hypothetical protein
MKEKKLFWANGLKIDSTLQSNLKGCVNRVNSKKASLIVIDGGVGEGKTTLGTICGLELASEMNQEFSIKDQVRQGGADFLKGMDWCVKNNRNVIIYDEAGDFNTRASLTYFNQNMNRVFETYRALKIIVILCLPSFADIDTSLMKKKIARMLIHCYARNNHYGNYKVYSLWRAWYLKAKFVKVTVPDDAFRMVSPNFYGRFRDLNPDDAAVLEVLSIAAKKSIIQEGMLKERGLINIKEIAHKTGYSIETIRRYTKAKNLKGEKSGATLFYHKEIVENILIDKEREGRVAL